MATVIVVHRGLDVDAVLSAIALEKVLREVLHFGGQVRFEFIEQGTTFRGIAVDPTRQYEQLGSDRVYHLDCGRGLLDHHRGDCKAQCSLSLVNSAFDLVKRFPEWARLVRWAIEADNGGMKHGASLRSVIAGLNRLYGSGREWDVFQTIRTLVEALLENEKVRVSGAEFKIEPVPEFLPLPQHPSGDTVLMRVLTVPGFGNVGLMIAPDELRGTLRNQLHMEGMCRLVISLGVEDGKVGIMSCFPPDPQIKEPQPLAVDLGVMGVVTSIRAAEAALRNLQFAHEQLSTVGDLAGLPWFAHGVMDGELQRVANLFCGSAKKDLTAEEKSLIPWEEIVKLVLDCIHKSHS